jgi:hypothetical protein
MRLPEPKPTEDIPEAYDAYWAATDPAPEAAPPAGEAESADTYAAFHAAADE